MLKRLIFPALSLLIPAFAAAAQVRSAPPGAQSLIPSLGVVAAVQPLSGGSLSAFSASPTVLAAPAEFAAPASQVLSPIFAAPAGDVPAALVPSESIPQPALQVPEGTRPVLHSLAELSRYVRGAQAPEASRVFDGAAPVSGEPVVDSEGVKPAVPSGVREVVVVPLRSGKDVDLFIPRLGNAQDFHDALKRALPRLPPVDAVLYRGPHGDRFTGLNLSGHSQLVDSVPGLQPHEIDTIKKIQAFTQDLQLLVREEGQTPDLVIGGVVSELKSIRAHDEVSEMLGRANSQLRTHAQRHHLGLGAVVLDILDAKKAVPERVEAEIESVVKAAPGVGFNRVYVFAEGGLKTYSPDRAGVFRLDPSARAFLTAALPGPSFVPHSLERAILPDMATVTREIQEPSRLLRERGIHATVTVYGSARILSPEQAKADLDKLTAAIGPRPQNAEDKRRLAEARKNLKTSKYYRIAREFGGLVATEGQGEVALVSGGGPGIMEGANRGAFEAGGPSVGYNIKLPNEQGLNPYATPGLEFEFEHFSTRKMALRHGAMGLVYFPGGFGTLDELFEVLTLIQTGKMARVPLVLVGEKSYWNKVLDFDEFARMGLISPGDLSLFTFAETAEQAWKAVVAGQPSPSRP